MLLFVYLYYKLLIMFNLNKKQLSLLSLLVLVGNVSLFYTMKTNFVILSYIIIFIGALAYGVLLSKK